MAFIYREAQLRKRNTLVPIRDEGFLKAVSLDPAFGCSGAPCLPELLITIQIVEKVGRTFVGRPKLPVSE
jgi:hypothetical protein